ncbi:MAG: lysylphosphatidylglycerol synthase domain-containing protein [Bacteroidales bacterium]|nr:lysylphosphatidylglycerol synthase domain-containing protein [Bacteroidales bacterium]MDD4672025.1 lysylphosphatidylglycerol synthase domain-containing protein [Bacteroidales bacterium]MDY0347634.1 lysylphosphatidylglycerol synthase domain-containing protein [Tenuifilaceae bacterium]
MPRAKVHLIAKILVAVMVFGFVVWRIGEQWDNGFFTLSQLGEMQERVFHLYLILLLAPINWIIEAYKWQTAITKFEPTSVFSALKIVWYGIGAGLFTPNRIGDPIARVAMLNPVNRGQGAVMAAVCAMSQQLATILFGGAGFLLTYMYGTLPAVGVISGIAILFVAGISLFTLVVVFKYEKLASWLQRIKPAQRWLNQLNLSLNAPAGKTMPIVLFSILRYAVFSTQLLLMLLLFGYNGSCASLYPAIFLTYMFASVIPTFAMAEAGVRSGFAIIFIGTLWANPTAIALAILSLWVINVALPGTIGVWSPFFRKQKLDLQKGYMVKK